MKSPGPANPELSRGDSFRRLPFDPNPSPEAPDDIGLGFPSQVPRVMIGPSAVTAAQMDDEDTGATPRRCLNEDLERNRSLFSPDAARSAAVL